MMLRLICLLLGAAGASMAVGLLIVLSQRWHGKHTFDHDLKGVQKFHTTAVPRIGGVAIVAALLFVLLGSFAFETGLTGSKLHLTTAILLLVSGLPVFIAGAVEDLTKTVSVKVRLSASILSALTASALLGATLDEIDVWGVDSLLAWSPVALFVTAVVVSGGINAINIIDGFNGLAGGTVALMLTALGVVAWHVGDSLIVELAFLGVGATVGFLALNFPTGRLFLGDGGAYFLGFWVAELAVLLLLRNDNVNAWQVLSICAYPVIEVLFSIYRRKYIRQVSPGAPDRLHLHTLVYRRVVSKYLSPAPDRAWKRNAAVSCIMLPWIASIAMLSVVVGAHVVGAMSIVAGQTLLYIAVYGRLVRGRWGLRPVAVSNVVVHQRPDAANADDCSQIARTEPRSL